MSQSTNLARSTVRQLIELGISDVVISPGSRNAPLSLAFAEAASKNLIRMHLRIDERSAAFFALGLSKASNQYVPVLSTSGTAVANYFPALLEAYHSGNKLLLLTADRPERLRKTGANQTTLQSGIFGNFVSKSIDSSTPIDISNLLNGTGPIHINLQFDEPLLPSDQIDWLAGVKIQPLPQRYLAPGEISINQKRTLIILGHDKGGFDVSELNEFIKESRAVLISEDPLAFPDAIAHHSIILSSEKARSELTPDLVIVIGRTTLTRSTNALINGAKRIMVIDPKISEIDTRRSADEIHSALPKVLATESDPSWRAEWERYSKFAAMALEAGAPWSETRVAQNLSQFKFDAFFIASSRPIRDIEAAAVSKSSLNTFANRGLAGIDGNISTAMGIATQFNKTLAVLGDLAFLHDISALTNEIDENLTILVVDNNGGGIFSTLPQRGVPYFEEVFGTPHNKSIKKIASGFGIKVLEVESVDELNNALSNAVKKPKNKGVSVVVAKVPDRESNADNLASITSEFNNLIS
jgi:2-succinyl-5-enolpyruvyl-6-hydroxy-3-cyclohexene-1-carboxylate synthase